LRETMDSNANLTTIYFNIALVPSDANMTRSSRSKILWPTLFRERRLYGDHFWRLTGRFWPVADELTCTAALALTWRSWPAA
jgi:hypothetical protein